MITKRVIFGVVFVALTSMFGIEGHADGSMDYSKRKVSENTGMYSVADIFNSADKSDVKWNGCDPAKYRDMKFYDKDGKALIRGIINDYSPERDANVFSIRTKNLLNKTDENAGTLNSDGTFEIEIPITYPHLCTFSFANVYTDLYLAPGDTLDVVSTAKRNPANSFWREPEYVGFRGDFDDVVAINLLNDSIEKHYKLSLLWMNYPVRDGEEMKGDTYKANESLANLLDSVVTDLPDFIGNLPVSDYVKDVAEAVAAANISHTAEYLDDNFRLVNRNSFSQDEEGNILFVAGDRLDMKVKFAPWLKHKDLLFDNPLMLCTSISLPSGWRSNDLFNQGLCIACEMVNPADTVTYYQEGVNTYDRLRQVDAENLQNIGVGNCFAAQYVRCMGLCKEIGERGIPDSRHLEANGERVRNLMRLIDYDPLGAQLMTTFQDYMKDVLIAENRMATEASKSKFIHDSDNIDTLEKLIADYKGNVVFLDFWSIGCGPCLDGIKKQKPLVEQYSDRPFKALYIATDDVSRKACERWLDKNGIKGEHVFVTVDDWRRLSSIFNFSSIPFGVLIDKKGEVIATHCDIIQNTKLLDDALAAE